MFISVVRWLGGKGRGCDDFNVYLLTCASGHTHDRRSWCERSTDAEVLRLLVR